jgi:hypothetical protein
MISNGQVQDNHLNLGSRSRIRQVFLNLFLVD